MKSAEEFIWDKRNERFPTHLSLSQTQCTHTDALMWAHEYAQSQTEEKAKTISYYREWCELFKEEKERLRSDNEAIAKHNADLLKTIEKGEEEINRLKEEKERARECVAKLVWEMDDNYSSIHDDKAQSFLRARDQAVSFLYITHNIDQVESKETPN